LTGVTGLSNHKKDCDQVNPCNGPFYCDENLKCEFQKKKDANCRRTEECEDHLLCLGSSNPSYRSSRMVYSTMEQKCYEPPGQRLDKGSPCTALIDCQEGLYCGAPDPKETGRLTNICQTRKVVHDECSGQALGECIDGLMCFIKTDEEDSKKHHCHATPQFNNLSNERLFFNYNLAKQTQQYKIQHLKEKVASTVNARMQAANKLTVTNSE